MDLRYRHVHYLITILYQTLGIITPAPSAISILPRNGRFFNEKFQYWTWATGDGRPSDWLGTRAAGCRPYD
jgi:xanthosine utilization system XapX-like protein